MVAKVVIIGIVLVFTILVLLTLLIMLLPKLMGRKSAKENRRQAEPAAQGKPERGAALPETENAEELPLICVLSAAVAAYRSSAGEDADPRPFKVVAFRKTPRRDIK